MNQLRSSAAKTKIVNAKNTLQNFTSTVRIIPNRSPRAWSEIISRRQRDRRTAYQLQANAYLWSRHNELVPLSIRFLALLDAVSLWHLAVQWHMQLRFVALRWFSGRFGLVSLDFTVCLRVLMVVFSSKMHSYLWCPTCAISLMIFNGTNEIRILIWTSV